MSTETQCQRILVNCKKIWGADMDFDLETETDEYEYYSCHVRHDRGITYGPVLIMSTLCDGKDSAWNEVDRMLLVMAKSVDSGRAMTKDERLEAASGPNEEWRDILRTVMEKKDELDAKAAAKTT
jgi:alpha-glucuronidase